jgi:hypothetical protein
MELVKIDILLKWIWLLKFKQNNITVYWSKLLLQLQSFYFTYVLSIFLLIRQRQILFHFISKELKQIEL